MVLMGIHSLVVDCLGPVWRLITPGGAALFGVQLGTVCGGHASPHTVRKMVTLGAQQEFLPVTLDRATDRRSSVQDVAPHTAPDMPVHPSQVHLSLIHIS